jgi:membrane fusion protein (multidrug efflux system)
MRADPDARLTALAANVALREAEVARAEDDLRRRQGIATSGAVSSEELRHAEVAVAAARAARQAAREQLAANRSNTDGTTVAQHPNVQRAAARLREAFLAAQRGEVLAPIAGQVAKRNVQVGQRVQAGTPLMAVIPLDALWVDANFKEVQLARMRIGQPAAVTADIYGDKVVYHGRVAGLGAGTGAAFALLPAQNATGNWIKVVQRVPVRIEIDPADLKAHPLRVGLSNAGGGRGVLCVGCALLSADRRALVCAVDAQRWGRGRCGERRALAGRKKGASAPFVTR